MVVYSITHIAGDCNGNFSKLRLCSPLIFSTFCQKSDLSHFSGIKKGLMRR